MLKPSKKHYLRYDAQTYETQGFIDLCGIPLKMHNDATKYRDWETIIPYPSPKIHIYFFLLPLFTKGCGLCLPKT